MYSAVASWMIQYEGHGICLLTTKCVFGIYQTSSNI